jgi:1-acyl-sn-glycerol-3-phosphate acyltransferase
MVKLLRYIWHFLVVRPLVFGLLRLRVRHHQRLPAAGPAVVVANHNSHLDTLALTTQFPLKALPAIRPVAAADYFLRGRLLAWFATRIMGVIAIRRNGPARIDDDPLRDCSSALRRGEILIFYPEGTRGEPEQLGPFKMGLAHLMKQHPEVPVYPIFLQGFGRVLPKGSWMLRPYACRAVVGPPLCWGGDHNCFMGLLRTRLTSQAPISPYSPFQAPDLHCDSTTPMQRHGDANAESHYHRQQHR